MNIKLFYHSLVSDWNHGNAHFLRGIARELIRRGHRVDVYEPVDAWSRVNLVWNEGERYIDRFYEHYPELRSKQYYFSTSSFEKVKDWFIHVPNGSSPAAKNKVLRLNLECELSDADLVIVHEWNEPALVKAIGKQRQKNPRFKLLFHDTHHRSVTAPEEIRRFDLSNYDGVLAFGAVIRDLYQKNGWTQKAWTWHEAADTTVFYPRNDPARKGDVIWIGNWGDDERSRELRQFLIHPVRDLGIRARIYGVRYPQRVIAELKKAGITYGGWLPNYNVPEMFSKYKVTVHVPRAPYARVLRGIPTIRPFEALACGIPLLSAPWTDCEELFRPGKDILFASDGRTMKKMIKQLLNDAAMRREMADNGLETIRKRHSCIHRVDDLMRICKELEIPEERWLTA